MKIRMLDWLAISALLVAIIGFTSPHLLLVGLFKLTLQGLAAVVGYRIERSLFPYARPDCFLVGGRELAFAAAQIRRAIIVAACMIGVGLGA
jgi:hypothetical protein